MPVDIKVLEQSANKTISVVDELIQTYDVMQIKLQNII